MLTENLELSDLLSMQGVNCRVKVWNLENCFFVICEFFEIKK